MAHRKGNYANDYEILENGDYYCRICDAKMNNEDMREAHFAGKRHLKKIRKPKNPTFFESRYERDIGSSHFQPSRSSRSISCSLSRASSTSSEENDSEHGNQRLVLSKMENFPYSFTMDARIELAKQLLERMPLNEATAKVLAEGCQRINMAGCMHKLRTMRPNQLQDIINCMEDKSFVEDLGLDKMNGIWGPEED